jgi:hypothetical protein
MELKIVAVWTAGLAFVFVVIFVLDSLCISVEPWMPWSQVNTLSQHTLSVFVFPVYVLPSGVREIPR